MMISTIKPYGALTDFAIRYRFEQDGEFYVVDMAYNIFQVSNIEYHRLRCPIRKMEKKVRLK